MTIQTYNLGSLPDGIGGDTYRATGAKYNETVTNNTHAASRYVGTAAGNVMEVGAFGFGGAGLMVGNVNSLSDLKDKMNVKSCILRSEGGNLLQSYSPSLCMKTGDTNVAISIGALSGDIKVLGWTDASANFTAQYFLRTSLNTTVDSNGFIKAASPIVQLFADKIELNDEAAEQDITFEKVDVGHYLIKGSSGFSNNGWWIEVPTDKNGNKICAVDYQTLENGDLEIKTFKKKINDEGDIIANIEAPIDIPKNSNDESRWIDIRLNEIKKPMVMQVPRTEKQAKMVQRIKYAPQLVYIMLAKDMVDDDGKLVIVGGKQQEIAVSHIQVDANGTPILQDQPVMNPNGEPVFEWVQATDSLGALIFEDIPVLDAQGNQIIDEVVHEPQ